MSLLDLIFPKKCISCQKFGDFICANCFSKIKFNEIFICPHCFRPSVNSLTHPYCTKPYGIDGVISAVVYQNVIKRLLHQFKYDPHLHKLDTILGELMCEALSQNESFYNFLRLNDPILVPIPLSPKRFRQRGYNHAELLTSYVAQYFSLKINTKLLVRTRDTKPQYELGRKARQENISGAFSIRSDSKIPNSIILVDDLATTFSTLKEAAKVLKRAGAKKVIGITFAREL